MRYGLKPNVIAVAVFVEPSNNGNVATIPSAGVIWRLPPNGISTVLAPIVESNCSLKPFWLHTFKSFKVLSQASFTEPSTCFACSKYVSPSGIFTTASVCCFTPFVWRKERSMLTISLPRQFITRRGSLVTVATSVASRFSFADSAMNLSASLASTTTAIRSWDSEIASSVPSRPSYFFLTLSSSITRPSVNSPIATATPPAPKSLQRLIKRLTSGFLNNLCNLRSVGGLPFCTSAPHWVKDSKVCSLEEPVAPPIPSRPVRPPTKITTSPGCGSKRSTFSFGAAATTAPISRRFAA